MNANLQRARRQALNRNQAELPSGPSILLDAEGNPMTMTQQIAAAGGAAGAPVRPKIHVTEQAMDEALQLSSEGKITSKNAWDIKLIEGMEDSVRTCIASTVEGRDDDQYQQFTRVANLVEGGAKVWTHRVESTYLLSTQMVRRLLRNDGKDDGDDGNNEGGDGGENNKENEQRANKRKRRTLERTIAQSLDEIDQDRTAKAAQTQSTVSPMFRAMTEKFDQGHAQGLLCNNAPFGARMNHILDIDFSAEPAPPQASDASSPKQKSKKGAAAAARNSGGGPTQAATGAESVARMDAVDAPDMPAEEFLVPLPRLSQQLPGDGDGGGGSPSANQRLSGKSAKSDKRGGSASDPSMLADFSINLGAGGLQAHMVPRTSEVVTAMASGNVSRAQSLAGSALGGDADLFDGPAPDYDDDGGAGGDWGGEDDEPDFSSQASNATGTMSGTTPNGGSSRAGSMARGFVSGAAGMEVLDNFLGSREAMLGIQADDADWTPLASQPAGAGGAGGPPGFGANKSTKTMGDIRKQSVVGKAAGAAAALAGDADTADAQASKRKKREGGQTGTLTRIPVDLLTMDPIEIKLNKTDHTALQPLGKRWLVERSVDSMLYAKKDFQYARATENGLILSAQYDASVVSRAAPTLTYIPDEPSDIRIFFQPFSAHEPRWNILFKTARHANQATGATSRISRFDNGAITEDIVAEMPVDVFDNHNGADDYDDGPGFDDDGTGEFGGVHFDVPAAQKIDLPDLLGDFGAAVSSATGEGAVAAHVEEEPEVMIKRLRMTYATAPTMVDVVRLRRVMWDHTKRVAHARPVAGAAADASQADESGSPRTSGTLINASGAAGQVEFDGQDHYFSEVVASMLPAVPAIAKNGSLSPAFFFFSMLFLVNEHGIDLRACEDGDLNDLVIKGLIPQRR